MARKPPIKATSANHIDPRLIAKLLQDLGILDRYQKMLDAESAQRNQDENAKEIK